MQLFSSWTGSDFLLFYIMLLGLSAFAAWWIPAHLRDSGRRSESPDAEDIAMLAGGAGEPHRFGASPICSPAVALAPMRKTSCPWPSRVCSPAPQARALLAAREPFSRGEASKMLSIHASRITARLRREGLLLRPETLMRLRWLSIAPFAALFLTGLYRQRAGAALGEPTGFLAILMGLTAALAVIRFVKFDQRTMAGIQAVSQMREKSARLKRAPQASEAAMAVALFGTGVLVGTPWEPVHAMRQQGSGDGGGSGDSSSDGGGDGGGAAAVAGAEFAA